MTYTVYADLLLASNFIMDVLLLWLIRRMMRLEARKWGLAPAALLGALYALAVAVFPLPAAAETRRVPPLASIAFCWSGVKLTFSIAPPFPERCSDWIFCFLLYQKVWIGQGGEETQDSRFSGCPA